MTIDTRLAEIRARVENATPGPWDARQYPQGGGRVYEPDGYPLPGCFNCGENDAVYEEGDAEFIAASRTDLPALLAAVEAVMALHKCLTFPDDGIGEPTACGHCDNETWPCPTIRDITAALDANTTTREDQTHD